MIQMSVAFSSSYSSPSTTAICKCHLEVGDFNLQGSFPLLPRDKSPVNPLLMMLIYVSGIADFVINLSDGDATKKFGIAIVTGNLVSVEAERITLDVPS
ncbi:hypothetical protein CEXT_347271 [Caerostris extrusa]|uniref:Uncharacterized protein n=1 Tax=Caerostris extrusa TaxID=172846 RepID=A0AAV4VNI7_CAEEX|nr:hypothetical protein CEXT_347271 [Caerostris extrusa]